MKRNFKQYLALVFFLVSSTVFMSGCRDVFEKDITNKQVSINSPSDGAVNSIYSQLFWWNKLDGATQYAIQIVTPSFDSVKMVITDTIVGDVDKFYRTLDPGKYQWRIRAENGSYKTNYQVYTLTMLESPLENQQMILISPDNDAYIGQSAGYITFKWQSLYGATKYQLQIDTITRNFGAGLRKDTITKELEYTYPISKSGVFKWRVKALNDSDGETPWSETYKVTYLAAGPDKPTLSAPVDQYTMLSSETSITFKWTVPANSTASSYKLKLYDADNSNLLKEIAVTGTSNTVTLATINAVSSTVSSVRWTVTAVDKANQESTPTDGWVVKLTP